MYHDLEIRQQNERMCLPISNIAASCSPWRAYLVLSYTEDEATTPNNGAPHSARFIFGFLAASLVMQRNCTKYTAGGKILIKSMLIVGLVHYRMLPLIYRQTYHYTNLLFQVI